MNRKSSPKFLILLQNDLYLGLLIVLLSIFTAFMSYQSAIFDSGESDHNVKAQKVLAESNTEFLRANQDIIQDYTMYDGWYLNETEKPEVAEYYKVNFSDFLTASMEREGGPFDDEYYTQTYQDADSSYEEALVEFDAAEVAGDKANHFQLVMLIAAVGLSMAAWAALVDKENKLRMVFSGIAMVVFVAGVVMALM
jgi:hypothetical protein